MIHMGSGRLYFNDSYDEVGTGSSVVRLKKGKASQKRPDIEKPIVFVKGNHETPDELSKDIFKALKQNGFKQQAKNFRQDVNRILEEEAVSDADVLQIANRHCICNVGRRN